MTLILKSFYMTNNLMSFFKSVIDFPCLWGMITAKIKFGILLCCFPMRFLIFSLVFLMFSMMFAKMPLLFCYFCIRLFQTSMLYYSCPYAVMRNLDAIIRVRILLCETSRLLFVSVCRYAKRRCYYSCFELCSS